MWPGEHGAAMTTWCRGRRTLSDIIMGCFALLRLPEDSTRFDWHRLFWPGCLSCHQVRTAIHFVKERFGCVEVALACRPARLLRQGRRQLGWKLFLVGVTRHG